MLTKQELNVVRHIADGKSNKEIAEILNIRESTVKSHIKNIMRKTDMRKRSAIISHYLKENKL